MLARGRLIPQLWRYFGPGWLAYRLSYSARNRIRLPRLQIPASEWADQPLGRFLSDPALAEPERYLAYRRAHAPAFLFKPGDRVVYQPYFASWDSEQARPQLLADEVAAGTLRFFEHTPASIGFPPDWHTNAFTGKRLPTDRHWSEISDFGHGDIKVIWEPSRFGFVYALVRSYWRSGDERYPELFWGLVEAWRRDNRPQSGANWKCGQETSLRVMAWCFGLYAFMQAESTSAERVAMLAQMIAVSGRRIQANLSYALSQRNNHGISEGMGLWTIGILFPEFRDAQKWKDKGRNVLEESGRTLIYDDGSFVQHSVNYHRLMLHDYLWVLRLGDIQAEPFSSELKERVSRGGEFLYQLQDQESGSVPYYGENDGALILPLTNCDYQDFRPVVQATRYFQTGTKCYDSGAWDEELLWLFGPEAVAAPVAMPERVDFKAAYGGYYTLRSEHGFAFVRCATFHDRPGQADMLHTDIWWRGQNVALDAGTYSYNAPAPWNNVLGDSVYHNTVTVDGMPQMERAGKFLWLPWLRSTLRSSERSAAGHLAYWEGEHDGYQRLNSPVVHRRGILQIGDGWWLVLDRLAGEGDHSFRLHWLFPDVPFEWDNATGNLRLDLAPGAYYAQMGVLALPGSYSLVRADEHSPRGWRAPYYNYREPALSAAVTAAGNDAWFWTLLGPGPGRVRQEQSMLHVETDDWQASLDITSTPGDLLMKTVEVAGTVEDRLEFT